MFIKREIEKGDKKFVEIQKPDGDTVVLEVKEGVTKSNGANVLLKAKARQEAKEKEAPKAKAKKKV